MKTKTMLAGVMLAGLTAMAAAPAAMAESNDEGAEQKLVESARVTAAEAAKAVADRAGGKVSSVQITDMGGKAVYHVEVVNGGKQQDYAVDATSGDVSQMAANADDNDGGEGDDQD